MNDELVAGIDTKCWRFQSRIGDVAIARESLRIHDREELHRHFEHTVLAFQLRRRGDRRASCKAGADRICSVRAGRRRGCDFGKILGRNRAATGMRQTAAYGGG